MRERVPKNSSRWRGLGGWPKTGFSRWGESAPSSCPLRAPRGRDPCNQANVAWRASGLSRPLGALAARDPFIQTIHAGARTFSGARTSRSARRSSSRAVGDRRSADARVEPAERLFGLAGRAERLPLIHQALHLVGRRLPGSRPACREWMAEGGVSSSRPSLPCDPIRNRSQPVATLRLFEPFWASWSLCRFRGFRFSAQEIECSPQRRIALGVSQHSTESFTFLVAEDFARARFPLDDCASNRHRDVGQALHAKSPREILDLFRSA